MEPVLRAVVLQTLCVCAASQFVSKCGPETVVTGDPSLTVQYELGTVASKDAIQFTASWTTGYGAIGLRQAGTMGGMMGLDVYAFDSTTTDKVQDASAATFGAPVADAQQDAVVVSHSGTSVVFHRLLTTGDGTDFVLTPGGALNFAWATGTGDVFSGWSVHQKRAAADVTLLECPMDTPAPAAANTTAAPMMMANATDAPMMMANGTDAPAAASNATAAPMAANATSAPMAGNATMAPTVMGNETAAPAAAGNGTAAPIAANATAAPAMANDTMAPMAANATAAPMAVNETMAPTMGNATAAPMMGNATAVPMMANATAAPTMANETMAPMAANETMVPMAANTTAAPMMANATMAPMAANETAAPMLANETMAPTMANATAAPMAANQTSAPMLANETAVPMMANATASPMAANETMAPTMANATAAPMAANETMAPVSANTTSAPMMANATASPVAGNTTAAPMMANETASPATLNATAAPASANETTSPMAANATSAPASVGGTASPLAANETAAPLMGNETAAPVAMGGTPVPLGPNETAAPVVMGGTPVPLGPNETAAPVAMGGTPVPLGPNETAAPVAMGGTPVPLGPNETAAPAAPGTTSAPAAAGATPSPGQAQTGAPAGAAAGCPTFEARRAAVIRTHRAEQGQQEWFTPSADNVKHTPFLVVTGTSAVVSIGQGAVVHPSVASGDPTKVHYIANVHVVDQGGKVVAMAEFSATQDPVALAFEVPAGATTLTAFSFCNKHGLFAGDVVPVAVPGSASPACAVVPCMVADGGAAAGPCAQFDVLRAESLRRQKLEFQSDDAFAPTADNAKHTPFLTFEGAQASVAVGGQNGAVLHPTVGGGGDPGLVHYIETLYVANQDGTVVAAAAPSPVDGPPRLTFDVPVGTTELTAYALCNKHGLYKGATEMVSVAGTKPVQCGLGSCLAMQAGDTTAPAAPATTSVPLPPGQTQAPPLPPGETRAPTFAPSVAQGNLLKFVPCDVKGVTSAPQRIGDASNGLVAVTQTLGTVGHSAADALNSNIDAVLFRVAMSGAQQGFGDEWWGGVGFRKKSAGAAGMEGLEMLVADTVSNNVFKTTRGSGTAKPDAAEVQDYHYRSWEVFNGKLTFEVFRTHLSAGHVNYYDLGDAAAAKEDWEFVYARGKGRVFSTWAQHSAKGVLASDVRFGRCDAAVGAAPTETPAEEGGGVDVGVIIGIVLGVLACLLLGGFFYFKRRQEQKECLGIEEYVQAFSDPGFDQEFRELAEASQANDSLEHIQASFVSPQSSGSGSFRRESKGGFAQVQETVV